MLKEISVRLSTRWLIVLAIVLVVLIVLLVIFPLLGGG